MANKDEITITCAYCGHAYEPGTPTFAAEVLTEHIKICEKHPMRHAEARNKKLFNALAMLTGADTMEELAAMHQMLTAMPIPSEEKAITLNAVEVLLEEIAERPPPAAT